MVETAGSSMEQAVSKNLLLARSWTIRGVTPGAIYDFAVKGKWFGGVVTGVPVQGGS